MPLPPPAPRIQAHTRRIEYHGYHREDGLWDIEGHLRDTKAYDQTTRLGRVRLAGDPVHDMEVRVTIDDAMTVVDIHASMRATPFEECPQAEAPVRQLIGATLGRGWRKALDEAIGSTRGCTHLRELLFGTATAAFQTLGGYRDHLRQQRGEPEAALTVPPFFMGGCMSWDFDGPVVARVAPQFIGWHHRQAK
ncbi:DUF2889 domain-containing protein [Pseudorhodoferax sp. Leaf267]|uniref:DUF2889 domain-containing protein n=1 Tax=Pseudorhodoferax sp. Leaf267 TaxID=1736316 RepID=UPI0009E770BA|nr:DUF2889 domain-containing protein [Pseudorhodoferax sp. Leaf267]